MSYLAPTLRPPDSPCEKPPRPNLLSRIARRLKNYWNPPIEGSDDHSDNANLTANTSSEVFLLFFAACFLRASKSGRARAVAGAAAGDARAVYSDAQ